MSEAWHCSSNEVDDIGDECLGDVEVVSNGAIDGGII